MHHRPNQRLQLTYFRRLQRRKYAAEPIRWAFYALVQYLHSAVTTASMLPT